MKVFKVWVEECDYNEYDAAIIIAESAEEIRANFVRNMFDNSREFAGEDLFFNDEQGEIHIDEIDTNHAGLLLASYHAG